MDDTITIIASAENIPISKAFRGKELKPINFYPGQQFSVTPHPVHDLQSLAKLIDQLEGDPTQAVIRGTPLLSGNDPVARNRKNFSPASRRWCMIDIDSLPWDGDVQDHQAMLDHATDQLPVEFQRSDCWYHFSSSMGIKPGIRVHLWFWLDRPCSDAEMKTWLPKDPVDPKLFNPIQLHLTANPRFVDGATDPYPNRSGYYHAGKGLKAVPVPSDLESRAEKLTATAKPRTRSKSGPLDPVEVVRDPETGLAIDGREQLMFLLSNEVMSKLVTGNHTPSEDEVTEALWKRFCEETDISIVSDRGAWTISDALSKAKARLQELSDGTYSFVSRSDRTTLVAGSVSIARPKLIGAKQAEAELENILAEFFGSLSDGEAPRAAIRLTMGTGKTKQTIEHLTAFLAGRSGQSIEVYVPRHDLATDWENDLEGINAKVIHIYPRTGGKWDDEAKRYAQPIMCQRADYVRDLENKGHSIYGNACLSRTSAEQCSFFGECQYLDQFRPNAGDENTIRIYTHATLFLNRNEYERQITPDLVIIDEAFMPSAVSNMPSVSVGDITNYIRFAGNTQLGFDLVECLSKHQGDLAYLRDKEIGAFDFQAVSLESINPATTFNPDTTQSGNVRSAKLYRNLCKLLEIASREIEDHSKHGFEQLAFNSTKSEIVICEHKSIRVPRSVPVLYLDATADPVISEAYLPSLQYHQLDVRQLAVVSQVHDRTGSNKFWNGKVEDEQDNLSAVDYDPHHNDLAALIVILNEWVTAGESPLLVGHKDLCDFVRNHPKLDQGVAVAHFMSLRGTNEYKDRSAIFITGRNQPPLDDIDRQARAIFGNSGVPLSYDDLDDMPTDQIAYWLSDRSTHANSAINIPAFSDPRIMAVQKQIREAETVQAIARLRLVWADYQKRVFLLSNLPVEMPVDHLIGFADLIPDLLEMELIKIGDIPLTALGLEKMRPDLNLSEEAIKSLFRRNKASNPKSLLSSLPALVRTTTRIATFKAGDKRKRTHEHLFLPKDYSGDPTVAFFEPHTEAEVLSMLETGWGKGNVSDLQLAYLYEGEPEPEVSG